LLQVSEEVNVWMSTEPPPDELHPENPDSPLPTPPPPLHPEKPDWPPEKPDVPLKEL